MTKVEKSPEIEHILSSQYEDDPIIIMGHKIDCAVLENGQRVISHREFNKTLGITAGGGERNLPRFLYLKALERFIDEELMVSVTNPI